MIKKYILKFIFIFLIILIYPNSAVALEINPEEREDPIKSELLKTSYETFSTGKWYIPALDTSFTSNSGQGVTIAILDTGVTKTSYLSCLKTLPTKTKHY